MRHNLSSHHALALAFIWTLGSLAAGCSSKKENAPAPEALGAKVSPKTLGAKVSPKTLAKRQDKPSDPKPGAVKPVSDEDFLAQAGANKASEASAAKSSGTKKTTPSASPGIRVEEKAIEDFAPIPPSAGLAIVALVSVKSLEALEGPMAVLNGPGGPAGRVATAAAEDFKKKFGLKDVSWLRRDAPIHVIVSDIKADAGRRALILPISSPQKVKRAFSGIRSQGKSGHLVNFEVEGKKAFLDLVGDWAVISYADTFFSELKGYLEGNFKTYKPSGVLTFQVDVVALQNLYGQELLGQKDWLKEQIAGALRMDRIVGADRGLDIITNMAYEFLQSTQEVALSVDTTPEALTLNVAVTPVEGKALAKLLKEWKGRRSTLGPSVDPSAWFAVASYHDSRSLGDGRDGSVLLVESLARMLKLNVAEKASLLDLLERRRLNQTGDAMFSVYQDGSFPFAMSALAVVEDAALERVLHGDLLDYFFKILMDRAKKRLKGNRMGSLLLGASSLKSMVDQFSLLAMPFGLGLKLTDEKQGETQISALSFSIDWDNPILKGRIANVAMWKQLLGSTLSMAMAYHKKRVALAVGPKAIARARALAEGKNPGGQADLNQALAQNAVAFKLRPGKIAKILGQLIGSKSSVILGLSALGDKTAIHVRGKSDGHKALFQVSVPAPLFRAFR